MASTICSCSYPDFGIKQKAERPLKGLGPRLATRGWQRRETRRSLLALAGPDLWHGVLGPLSDHLFLAYERVVYPCQNMNCGDVVYRSSLDPVLRLEQRGLNPYALVLLALALVYLTATPGVLAGAIDYYILDKFQRITKTKPYDEDSFIMGKKLAQGGFGTVYRGQLKEDDGALTEVVIKRAKEFGEAEVWMNERLMRAAPGQFAEFVTAFEESVSPKQKAKLKSRNEPIPLWLVWKFEGDYTLWNLMLKKEFPYNVEELIFGEELNLPRGAQRSLITIKAIMLEILKALKASHATGIVHRDIKPQNVIISETDSKAKLIDLGAAADLRVGINYVPNEYLLDPRYAPPEQYIMSTQTPRAPPVPVAAALSPILWRLNDPDRFDMFSVGVSLIQMVFAPLRNDNSLVALRKVLSEQFNDDLDKWRATVMAKKTMSKDYAEGFQMMDMDNGAMWDLTKQLMAYDPSKRLSAPAALRHEAFGTGMFGKVNVVLAKASAVVDQIALDNNWVSDAIARANGGMSQGLTEAQLSDELGGRDRPQGLRASKTISWWQQRQMAFQRAAQGKQAKAEKENKRRQSTEPVDRSSEASDTRILSRFFPAKAEKQNKRQQSTDPVDRPTEASDTRILSRFFQPK